MAVDAPPQTLTDFLRSLRAVREFQRKPVPDAIVQDILEVARWSGSASNRQFGEVIVVRKPETLQALAGLGGYVGHLRGAAIGIVLVMPGEWPEGETFDEGRLAERIMLGAWAHGVGSSVGWFSPEGRKDAKRILGVPPKPVVRTAISLGYPAVAPRRGTRKPIDELVHEERHRAS
ncbi:MAG TPA: nitroreductase family protein [Steroidobacteraceae bacterium]|jgi:nitroreductase|nr:nitroreductase family protein [Steroidobacteraceae bacterium]